MGLFQELVLLCGDPDHLMPRAKWHLPSASAAELPLAHELPGEQVSETLVEQKPVVLCPISAPPLLLLGHLEGFLGEGFHHLPTCIHLVRLHFWGQASLQGLPVQLVSGSPPNLGG